MVWQAWLFSGLTGATLLAGIAAALWTALHLARRLAARGRAGEPACARCGYIVHPGSRRVCPECGSDLAAVGVRTPATLPPAYPVLPLWIGAVSISFAAAWAGPRLARLTPWGWHFRAGHVIATSRTNPGYLNGQGVFGVEVRGSGRWWGMRLQVLRAAYVTPMPSDHFVSLEVDPASESSRIVVTGFSSETAGFDRAVVRRFVAESEFDPEAGEGARVSAELWETLQRFRRLDLPPTATSPHWMMRDETEYLPDGTAGWIAVAVLWVAGNGALVAALNRFHRRRRRAVSERSRELVQDLGLVAA